MRTTAVQGTSWRSRSIIAVAWRVVWYGWINQAKGQTGKCGVGRQKNEEGKQHDEDSRTKKKKKKKSTNEKQGRKRREGTIQKKGQRKRGNALDEKATRWVLFAIPLQRNDFMRTRSSLKLAVSCLQLSGFHKHNSPPRPHEMKQGSETVGKAARAWISCFGGASKKAKGTCRLNAIFQNQREALSQYPDEQRLLLSLLFLKLLIGSEHWRRKTWKKSYFFLVVHFVPSFCPFSFPSYFPFLCRLRWLWFWSLSLELLSIRSVCLLLIVFSSCLLEWLFGGEMMLLLVKGLSSHHPLLACSLACNQPCLQTLCCGSLLYPFSSRQLPRATHSLICHHSVSQW